MKTLLLAAVASFSLACSGMQPGGGDVSQASPATPLFSGLDVYDAIGVQDGFVYVEVPGAGVQRCPSTGCAAPTPVVASDAFVSATLAGSVTYTTQIAADEGGVAGEVRSVHADGSGDEPVLAQATYPAYVATSGARTFWVEDSFAIDDTPASVQCIGCDASGGSTPWIMSVGGGTYGMIADAGHVYVLADDASLASVSLLSCSADAPCFGEPRVVLGGLDRTVSAVQLASDGTNVYVARATQGDVVRVDPAGAITTVLAEPSVAAIAYDASTDALVYATTDGLVGRVSADGSGASATLAKVDWPVAAVAVDDTNVYFVTGPSASSVMRTAK